MSTSDRMATFSATLSSLISGSMLFSLPFCLGNRFSFSRDPKHCLSQTTPNTRLCERITARYYQETCDSECKSIRLRDILPMVPMITTLRLIATPKSISIEEGLLLVSFPRLGTWKFWLICRHQLLPSPFNTFSLKHGS
jgi:hypothetical protein